MLTSMDCDGTQDGYDLALTRLLSQNVSVPVIASGGAGNLDHLVQAFRGGKADAVLAATLRQLNSVTSNPWELNF